MALRLGVSIKKPFPSDIKNSKEIAQRIELYWSEAKHPLQLLGSP